MNEFKGRIEVVVVGDANEIDAYAASYARRHQIPLAQQHHSSVNTRDIVRNVVSAATHVLVLVGDDTDETASCALECAERAGIDCSVRYLL